VEANFRFARQAPTIVTGAGLPFYDLPLIRPSGFVNSAAHEHLRLYSRFEIHGILNFASNVGYSPNADGPHLTRVVLIGRRVVDVGEGRLALYV
jgi:hypothetical protein